MPNVVAIVGRPNVGKSTLFNRLVGERDAIMDDQSGVTRDRHYGHSEWIGHYFTVIDTGGYVEGSEDKFESAIRTQVHLAIKEADVILFVLDAHVGLTDLDKDFADVVRRSDKPVFVVGNKSDTNEYRLMSTEFYALGMGEVYPISSQSGSGTGELLDDVVKEFKVVGEEDPDDGIPRIAVIGRPNAGKSSLINLLLGNDRSIVTDEAGTTRDAISSRYKSYGQDFIIVDTAGLRKKSKVSEDIEYYSNLRAISSLEKSDVVMIMVDASRGLEAQDMSIISLANQRGKGVLIVINKWDLIEKDHKTAIEFEKKIREKLGTLNYIPVIFTSVITKQRVLKAMEKAIAVYENKIRKIATSKLNDKLLPIIERNPPASYRGKYIRIKYITQLPISVPTFAFFCNHPKHIKEDYKRFLENQIREIFDFEGVTIKVIFRKKS